MKRYDEAVLLDTNLEGEDFPTTHLIIQHSVDYDECTGQFQVFMNDVENNEELSSCTHSFEVKNPLGMTIFLGVATCVAVKMTGSITKELYKHYKQSKEENPCYVKKERFRDFVERYKTSTDSLKETAVGTLVSCATAGAL